MFLAIYHYEAFVKNDEEFVMFRLTQKCIKDQLKLFLISIPQPTV